MKSVQKLLFAAALVSMMPSAGLFCSEEPAVTRVNPEDLLIIDTIAKERRAEKRALIINAGANWGTCGLFAGAQGFYSLKKIKNTLIAYAGVEKFKANDFTFSQLNKGIKNNKRLMALSFCATLPAAIQELKNLDRVQRFLEKTK